MTILIPAAALAAAVRGDKKCTVRFDTSGAANSGSSWKMLYGQRTEAVRNSAGGEAAGGCRRGPRGRG
jgi:hypothetical protein